MNCRQSTGSRKIVETTSRLLTKQLSTRGEMSNIITGAFRPGNSPSFDRSPVPFYFFIVASAIFIAAWNKRRGRQWRMCHVFVYCQIGRRGWRITRERLSREGETMVGYYDVHVKQKAGNLRWYQEGNKTRFSATCWSNLPSVCVTLRGHSRLDLWIHVKRKRF